ncbi:hypothetical protein P3T18_002989 [Paraburkholderia sp. GAS199]|uniref:hypothetical protein n=1 Tax=Paraburkholderia sp. GAS199 TaxID=3035126 RepID=UPI003D23C267
MSKRMRRLRRTALLSLTTLIAGLGYWLLGIYQQMHPGACSTHDPFMHFVADCSSEALSHLLHPPTGPENVSASEAWGLAILVAVLTVVAFQVNRTRSQLERLRAAEDWRAIRLTSRRRQLDALRQNRITLSQKLAQALGFEQISPSLQTAENPSVTHELELELDGEIRSLEREIQQLEQSAPAPPEPSERRLTEWFQSPRCVFYLCLLPWIIFFGAMIQHGQKDAAIFAMALAAIYVAAEHWSSLHEQKKLIGDERRELLQVRDDLQVKSDKLTRSLHNQSIVGLKQENVLSTIQTELAQKVGSIQNALGTAVGIRTIYNTFKDLTGGSGERGIYAIYRIFDIDERWWKSPSWKVYCGHKDVAGAIPVRPDPNGIEVNTLYSALKDGLRRDIVIVAAMTFRDPTTLGSQQETSRQFGALIGIIWHYLVLWHVRQRLRDSELPCDHQMLVIDDTITPIWFHVIGHKVFQILGEPGDELRVRDMTFDLESMAAPLVSWAKTEILALASRGSSAEEFICSQLSNAMPSLPSELFLNLEAEVFFKNLGGDAWLNEQKDKLPGGLTRDMARERCCKLIRDFLQVISAYQGDAFTPVNLDSESGFVVNLRHIATELE